MELDALVGIIEKPTWKSLLINTVKSEGMDPWSIDVVLLASKYGDMVKEMKLNDFRVPANAVLASAILVRFKSDSWNLVPKENHEEEDVLEEYEELGLLDFPGINEMDTVQRITTRRVTLEELIDAVETVMDKTKKKRKEKPEIPKDVMKLTIGEKEEFQKSIENVYKKDLEKADSENIVLFSDLVEEKKRPEVIRVLLSLLHLACEDRVGVWQEKEFGEIFVSLKEAGK